MSTKEEIIHSATELFASKGFDGVSIREIADHAKVHFASIRYHFGDKDDLYKACLSHHGDSRLNTARKYLDCEPSTLEDVRLRLSLALDETFQIHAANPTQSKLLLREVENGRGKSDHVLKRTMIVMTEIYVTFFKKCLVKKFITKQVDPLFLTQSTMGIIHHYMRTEEIRARILSQSSLKEKDFRENLVKSIVSLILD